jgi:DNA-binding CsgD family transcriptional regulator
MKLPPKIISTGPISGLRLDPTFTSEEAIILRALVAGKTDKQLCDLLRMSSNLFLRLMRDLREKTGTTNNMSLLVWAQRRMKSGDRRAVDRQERYARPARIEGISEQRNRGVGKVGG